MNILLVINSKYVKCGINMLRSLMESNDEKIRVFLAYRDLKEEEIEDVRKCLGDNELELLYIDKDKLNGLKDNDRALKYLDKVVTIFPEDEEAHEMIRKLS